MDVYKWNEKRKVAGEIKRTQVSKQVVDLDQYTLMNDQYAMIPFEEKSICEMISHLAKSINYNINTLIKFDSQCKNLNIMLNN